MVEKTVVVVVVDDGVLGVLTILSMRGVRA
jgi:hypothetical protein